MPAIDTQRGKRAPRRKPTLQIGDVVRKTQSDWAAQQQRKQSRTAERQYASQGTAVTRLARNPPDTRGQRLARGQEAGYRSQGRAVKLVADPHARKAAERGATLRQERKRAKAQEAGYRSQAESVFKQGYLQREVAEQARVSAGRTQNIKRGAFSLGSIIHGGGGTYRGADLPSREAAQFKRKYPNAKLAPSSGRHGVVGKTSDQLLRELSFYTQTPEKQHKQTFKESSRGHARRMEAVQTLSKGLEFAGRPAYAAAGAERAALRGEDISKAAGRGIHGKEHYGVSDVLGEAGWNPKSGVGKIAKMAVSITGDIAQDPVSWATFGESSLARAGARRAAKAAAKAEATRVLGSALARGESRAVARETAKRFANKAYDGAYTRHMANASTKAKTRGVEFRLAGKPVGGRAQVAATSALGRQIKKVAKPIAEKPKIKSKRLKTRQFFSAINAQVRPPGITKEEWNLGRQIKAERSATEEKHARQAAQRATTIRAATRPEEHEAMFHAVEAGEKVAGAAKPLKVSRRTAIRGRRRAKAVTEDPDRLNRINEEMTKGFNELREEARSEGIKVGHVGSKPPVHVPEVTADLKAERKAVGSARSDVARAEREQLEQRVPGGKPGPLTPAQKTRATRELQRAVDVKRAHLAEFQRITAQAKKVTSAGAKRTLSNRAKLVQTRIRSSQDAIDHWVTTLTKREVETKPMLQPSGKVTRAAAPMRAAPSAAVGRLTEALDVLKNAQGVRKSQLQARRTATKLAERRATEPKGYRPRIPASLVEKTDELTLKDVLQPPRPRGAGGAKNPKPSSAKSRDINTNQPLAKLEQGDLHEREYAGKFTKDPALIEQTYRTGFGKGISQARANNQLIAHSGRAAEPGKPLNLAKGDREERVYRRNPQGHIDELNPERTEDLAEMRAIERGETAPGEHVILNKALADFVNPTGGGIQNKNLKAIADRWTQVMGGWRSLALKTPTYVMHNATGDLFNGLGAQDPYRLAKNWVKANRALNERARSERGYKWFDDEMAANGKGTTTKIRGETTPYRSIIALAEAMGVIGHGRLAEAAEMAKQGTKKLEKPRGTSAWRQTTQRSEDMARLGTFIGMLDRGMPPEKAAKRVRDIHFDYGDLTEFEKGLRNYAMPFYTFSARNIPLQLKHAVTRPGIAASVQHARDEGQKQSGIEPDYMKKLDPYEMKQLGVPIKWGGKTYTVSSGLPITDLSALLPDSKILSDPKQWWKGPALGVGNRGLELLGPWKVLVENLSNHSLFYHAPIEEEGMRMTEVNPLIAKLADEVPGFADAFGIKEGGILNKQTGERSWAWSKKKENALRGMLPGPLGTVYRSSQSATSPRGFNPTQEAFAALTGIRAKPYEKGERDAADLNNQLREIRLEIGDIHQAGHNLTYQPTERLKQLERQKADLQKQLTGVQQGRLKFYKGRPTGASGKPAGKLQAGGGGMQKKIQAGGGGLKQKIKTG